MKPAQNVLVREELSLEGGVLREDDMWTAKRTTEVLHYR